jgi:hypothetical protein
LNSGKVNAVLPSLPGISDSVSTSNYDLAETQDGITQTGGYALYVYNLSAYASSFSDYGLLDITFGGAGLPKGTVALGWGCGGTSCGSDYTSVNTQSGFAPSAGTSVPEPASVVLFGTVVLLTLRLWKNRSGRSSQA